MSIINKAAVFMPFDGFTNTPRKIQGVVFDGTKDISLPVFTTQTDGLVPKRVGTTTTKYLREDGSWEVPTNTVYELLTQAEAEVGTATTPNTISAKVLKDAIQFHAPTVTNIAGNAETATKLQTPRTISLTGGVTGSVSFDGSANASIDTTITGLGTANGIATLDSSGKVPSTQLPSYVDDVLNFPDLASFPSVGEGSKIYIAEDVNKTYRWGGSSYVEIGGGGVALGETSFTAYRGDRGKVAYDHSLSQGNPHNTTTSDINEGTKLFFTESRVRQTVLTGLDTSTATPALATDQLLAAIGKLQAQINNIAPPVWVSAASIGTVHLSLTGMEFAKINGNLWVRGRYQSANTVANGTMLFTLTNAGYRIETPEASLSDVLIGQVQVSTNFITTQYLDLLSMTNPKRYYFKLRNSGVFDPVASPSYTVIQPTPIGKLLTP